MRRSSTFAAYNIAYYKMYLKNISLINFKSYENAELTFSPKLNCLAGNNGMGKTNMLDAIYYLCLCKSSFNLSDLQNIRYNQDFFVIQGGFNRNEQTENIYCGIKRNSKKIFKRNNKEYERLSDHIGLFPVVMISPSDSSLIIEGSEERRKFINSVISQYDKLYLDNCIQYNKALNQRNRLLKDFARVGNFNSELLEIWDIQLINLGEKIYQRRVEFISELLPVFQHYYEFVSLGHEKVELEYRSQLHHTPFKQLLEQSQEKDRILQFTTTGIHKDDLLLHLDGFPIKKSGSQGQQKTYLVALKLAQFDFLKNINNIKPILLLDDIFDKFDRQRVKQIIKLVADENFGQIFITDTSSERLEEILTSTSIDYKFFTVKDNGEIELKQ
ncbi:MAG: DNA replication/repair protein RecF [Bacteroidota bacterium]|nr:DNA replication/repair protein RecF [Bacteroidota bacterium]MDP4225489.1 DNA replication/repair protein RecF [Bacteroidota bacterium]